MSIISVKQALIYGVNNLKAANIESARLDAEILLSFVSGFSREKILINPQYLNISISQYLNFKKLISKRSKYYPIAYLIGSKEFYGIDFYVNKNVLVPRPETELLVEEVIKFVGQQNTKKLQATSYKLLEIGTGSGCISVTLAKYLPNTKITATDISEKALKVARKNRKKHGIKNLRLRKSNLLGKINSQPDIIVANLPYLTRDELREPSITKEPKLALYGGKDGLSLYENLLKEVKEKLIDNDSHLSLFFEVNPNQRIKLEKIVKKIFPKAKIEIKKDLSRKDRVFIIRL